MKLVENLLNAVRNLGAPKVLAKPFRNVTFAWPVEDASLMLALSKHFNKSSSSIGTEVFAPMMGDIFNALPEEVREQIAKDADDLIVQFINKNQPTEPVNLTCWQDFNSRGQH
ncbi:hypothetical protein D3C85_1003490 [compost metagenome]